MKEKQNPSAILKRLIEVANLKDDWDDEGAPPVDPAALGWAAAVAFRCSDVLPSAGIGPNLDGGAELWWNIRPGDLALYVTVDSAAEARIHEFENGRVITTNFDERTMSAMPGLARECLERMTRGVPKPPTEG